MEQIPSDTCASNDLNTNPSEPPKKTSRNPHIEEGIELKTDYKPRKTRAEIEYATQLKIMYAIATYKSDEEIKDLVRIEENGYEITKNQIAHYRCSPSWRNTLQKFRDEFEDRIADEEFSSKRRRLQQLTKAYQRLAQNDDTLMDSVKVLAQMREEVEGKTSGGTSINQYNQYNGLSDEDLRKIIAENTRFLEISEKTRQKVIPEVRDEEITELNG